MRLQNLRLWPFDGMKLETFLAPDDSKSSQNLSTYSSNSPNIKQVSSLEDALEVMRKRAKKSSGSDKKKVGFWCYLR